MKYVNALALACLCLMLVSCVGFVQVGKVGNDSYRMTHSTQQEQAPIQRIAGTAPVQAVGPAAVPVAAVIASVMGRGMCKQFMPPIIARLPVMPTFTENQLEDKEKVSLVMAQHITDLRAYTRHSAELWEEAYGVYLASCRDDNALELMR